MVLLSGGECTVTRRGDGVGGPNAEFCLALALALDGAPGIFGLACDTDGVDGAAEVAGAIVTPDTLARRSPPGSTPPPRSPGTTPTASSRRWATRSSPARPLTNVNDFRAILVEPG